LVTASLLPRQAERATLRQAVSGDRRAAVAAPAADRARRF
jgi:hypothetical protein